jgi:hypothetical protein
LDTTPIPLLQWDVPNLLIHKKLKNKYIKNCGKLIYKRNEINKYVSLSSINAWPTIVGQKILDLKLEIS